MSRRPAIDRNQVLNTAEAIVRTNGIAGLTIGAVAKAAGISKGGVQSAFGTKDQLVHAMLERWNAEYVATVRSLAGDRPQPLAELAAHIEATGRTDEAEADRAAGLMGALLDAQAQRALTTAWYRSRMDLAGVAPGAGTEAGRRARLAFLATEGVFMLRCFGFLPMKDDEWRSIFDDIRALLPPPAEEANDAGSCSSEGA
jgi:AcrR family transcriptional regulator